jgi:hypothetical protein
MVYAAGMTSRYPAVVGTRCARILSEELERLTMLDKSSDYRCLWLSDSSEEVVVCRYPIHRRGKQCL